MLRLITLTLIVLLLVACGPHHGQERPQPTQTRQPTTSILDNNEQQLERNIRVLRSKWEAGEITDAQWQWANQTYHETVREITLARTAGSRVDRLRHENRVLRWTTELSIRAGFPDD